MLIGKQVKIKIKQKMSKFSVKSLSVFMLGLLLATFASSNPAHAADVQSNTSVYLQIVRCDASRYTMTKVAGLRNCYADFIAGNLNSYIVSSDTLINADDYLLIVPHVVPDTTYSINDVLLYFTIPNTMTILKSSSSTNVWSIKETTDWDKTQVPAWDDEEEDYVYPWVANLPTYQASSSRVVNRIKYGSGIKVGLSQDTMMPYFGVKVNSDIQAGGDGIIHIGKDKTEDSSMSDYDGNVILYSTTDYQANYGGTAPSQDATLSSLSVTKTDGSVTYPLSPSFTTDTASINQKEYSTKVPSGVSQVKINATANDNGAQDIRIFDGNVENTDSGGSSIVSGTTTPIVGVGTKSVNPGANEFTIAVTSENGNILNQVVNIYRLSNDADLSNLSVDGYNFAETFNANTLNYTISGVPYSTKSLNIVGAKHDSKASVTGLGSWSFDTDPTAATTFTRDIVITPEECNYTTGHTEVVQGATCTTKTYTITVNREAASTDANLKSLSASYVHTTGSSATTDQLITSSSASQTFTLKDGTNNESVPYAADSVNFTATANQAKAKGMTIKVNNAAATPISTSGSPISGSATCALNVGDNTCVIEVTAEDGTHKQSYTVNAHRRSNDASLKSLNVSATPNPKGNILLPAFPSSSNDTYSYSYNEAAPSYLISAEVKDTDKTASVVMNRSGVQKTTTGNSISETYTPSGSRTTADVVMIVVTAEDGNTRTYTINLTREASSDASLSEIKVTTTNGTTPTTQTITPTANTYNYTIEVDPDVDTITDVTATATSSYATVNASDITYNSSLTYGSNTITVKGSPETGQKSQYNITVNRKKYNIAGASKIEVSYGSSGTWTEVSGVSANADGTFNLYTQANPLPFATDNMSIRVTPAGPEATVTGEGTNLPLIANQNNAKVVKVTAQDGSATRTYTLNVYREGNPNTDITDLRVKSTYIPVQQTDEGDKKLYTLSVPFSVTSVSEAEVAVATADPYATVTKSGTLTLNAGTPADYNFTVTSQSGNTQDYIIRITREQNNQSGANHIDLRLDGESSATRTWVPSSGQTSYTFSIPYNKSDYYLETTPPEGAYLSHDAGYVDNDDLLTIDSSGTSTHKIKVISQDGNSETEYTITVTREKSSDNTLANLYLNYINDGEAVINQQIDGFQANKTTYFLTVPGTTTEMRVGAELADKRGTFTSTNTNTDYDSGYVSLSYGLNTIFFVAKAENGAEQTYYVNVTRESKKNPYIQSITINGNDLSTYLPDGVSYTGATDGGVYEYTLKNFPNSTSSITIDATMVDAPSGSEPGASSVLISNNQALPQNVGIKTLHYGGAANLDNKIEIYGVAHDSSIKQKYILHIYRDPSDDARASEDADAVQIFWDGSWHNATWNGSELAYEITVPNSVSSVKGGTGGNFQAKPAPAPENGAAGTVTYDAEKTLITDDPATGNINDYGFTVTAEDGVATRHYTVKITKEKSDNANLASIAVNDAYGTSIGSFNPSFAADKYAYTVTVGKDVSEIYIAANPAEGHANVSGTGRQIIDGIDDVFTIEVIPENGDASKKKTYTLTIERQKSDDATLSAFKVTNLNDEEYTLTPPFNSGVSNITYQVTIPGDQDRVKLVYEGSNKLAEGVTQTIVYTETPDESTNIYNIPTGSSRTIGVRVTAENGTTEKTYNVQINRTKRSEAALDLLTYLYSNGESGSLLESCVVGGNGYVCDLGQIGRNQATTVTFGGHATDGQAAISGTGEAKEIKIGRNSYQVIVTAEDGTTTQTYDITLIRKPSEDALLTNINVKNGTGFSPNMSSSVFDYEVTMDEEKTSFSQSDLTITRSVNSSVVVYGEPISLTAGADNWYTIVVNPESCDDKYADLVSSGVVNCTDNIKTYRINVKRPLSTNNYLTSVEVDSEDVPDVDQSSPARLSPSFTKVAENYTITIPYGDNNFYITAEPEKDVSVVSDNVGCTFTAANNYTCRVYYNDLTNGDYRITVTPQSGTNPRTYKFAVSIAESSDNNLASLVVLKDGNPVELTPGFDRDKTNYTIPDITNDVPELIVQATENNSDASFRYIYQNNEVCGETGSCRIAIDPSKTLQTIKIEVTPADGSAAKIYRIDFNIKKDNDADLASLTVDAPGALNTSFDAGTTEYTVTGLTYENVAGPIALKFKTSDPDAKISINGGTEQTSGTVEWTTNLNFDTADKNAQTIVTTIKVIAEDSSSKTYTITATRAAALASTDATLASLEVTDETLSPAFTADWTEYDLGEINYQKRNIELKIGPNNDEASVFVNGNAVEINGGIATTTVDAPLTNNEQTVTIRVLASDKTTDKIYTVKFHKVGDSDTSLSSLSFTNGLLSPEFTPTGEAYTLTLSEGQQTEITAVPAGENATMTFGSLTNMKNLEPGKSTAVTGLTDTLNIRYLTILSEDGNSKTITINIVRATGEDLITSQAYGHNITARNVSVAGDAVNYGYILSVADRDIGAKAADGSYPDYEASASGSMTVEILASQLDNQRANLHFYKPNLDADGIFIGKGQEITTDEVIGTGTVVTLEVGNVLKDQVIVIIKGDTSGDGKINYKDRAAIINHNSLDGAKMVDGSLALVAADINNDGKINYKDRAAVINHNDQNGANIDYGSMLNPGMGGGAPPGS